MPDTRNPNERLAALSGPAYAVALLLVVTPLGDFLSGVWPWRVSALDWRFASSGLLSGFLLTPLLGALIAIVVAAARGHHGLLRGIGIGVMSAAILWLVVLAAFVLDALQLNASMPAEQKRAFQDASMKAVFKYVLASAAALWLGKRAFSLGRGGVAERAPSPGATIILGAEETSR